MHKRFPSQSEGADYYSHTLSLDTNSIGQGGPSEHFLSSTDSTLVILYNFRSQKYQFTPEDKERIRDYYDPDQFERKVLTAIVSNPNRMPFTQQISFAQQLITKIIKYILLICIMGALFYSCFFFLFNPVIVVMCVGIVIWLFISLGSLEEKIYDRSKSKPLEAFLKKINQQ